MPTAAQAGCPSPRRSPLSLSCCWTAPTRLPHDLAGVKVLVTAGGTREPIDPVRFIGNRSSGKQGYAMARVAAQRGADVTLIAGNTAGLVDPAGVEVVHIGSASQLQDAVSKHAPDGARARDGGRRRRLPAGPRRDQQDQEVPRPGDAARRPSS